VASRKSKRGGRYTPPRHWNIADLIDGDHQCPICLALSASVTIPESPDSESDDVLSPRNEERPAPDRTDRSDTRPKQPRRDQCTA
jgi:hypothetical protein